MGDLNTNWTANGIQSYTSVNGMVNNAPSGIGVDIGMPNLWDQHLTMQGSGTCYSGWTWQAYNVPEKKPCPPTSNGQSAPMAYFRSGGI
jgi:hypothetical protein